MIVSIQNLSLSFGTRVLISDATASFASGTLTALVGRNGTGKSTLLRALAGINGDYSGSILLDGFDLRSLTPRDIARRIAFVSTRPARIPHMRSRDIVAIGRAPYTDWIGRQRPEDRLAVDRALELVGMTEYADRTLLTMSDGECQRIMIARALAQDTPVILLDEPTSFLDVPGRYRLADLLRTLAHEQGKCIIYSTHELDIATTRSDTIALIDTPQFLTIPAPEARPIINRIFGI